MYEPAEEILVLIAKAQRPPLNFHAYLFSESSSRFWSELIIHTLCKQEAKAVVSLHICAGSPKPRLLDNVISTNTLCAGLYGF